MPTHSPHLRPLPRLLGTLLVLAVLCLTQIPVAWSPEASPPRGHLLIVGGGDTPPEAQQRFVALAGGPGRARIAVFPMASTDGDEKAGEIVDELRALGADARIVHLSRDEAASDEVVAGLDELTGFWFCGGDQARLASILRGTATLTAIQKRYFAGAIVGGTSAGAAVMSTTMLTGKRYRGDDGDNGGGLPAIARGLFEIDEGFGFLPGVIVDQHFLRRSRHNRLLSAVLERPDLLGVGIDEGTAILVRPDRRWEVLGHSYVKVFDARRAQITSADGPWLGSSDITLHLLPSRSVYDPSSGRTQLPAAI